ncbi:MAG: hypothetical protein QXI32_01505 [Candidatus Bathyarchaeia archaeon]
MTVHRVSDWEKFKSLVLALKPDTVFYLSEPHPLRRPPIGLRLTFYHGQDMYVFTDYADGEALHRTKIPISNSHDEKKAELREDEVRRFLLEELGTVKLASLPPFIY